MNKPSPSDRYSAYSLLQIVVNSQKFIEDLDKAEGRFTKFAKTCAQFGTPIQELGEAAFAPFAKGASIFAAFDDVMRRVGAVTAA